ncbi:MAG: isoleucine--tRNA ligase [Proteobacteria bacterium]|nr:isoleucine--tRNA ligase [Pseudomonadota bacterium]
MATKEKQSHYPQANHNPNFAKLELAALAKWKAEETFRTSVRGESEFIFYDGPPFANGLPHYGHFLTSFIKDLFARYQTMRGKKVDRRFGWDCHGLPAEMEAEKTLGISGRLAVEEYGVDKFNEHCRNSVLRYTKEWENYVTRQGRWVDFTNDYKTMDISFMESVIWAFKALFDKGLIYESTRVMPYSWACQTPVSDFETRMDNSYREKTSKAVTVAFNLASRPAFLPDGYREYKLLAWTTTPWTLPSNLALAVGEELEYVALKYDDVLYIIAAALAEKYEQELGLNEVARFTGKQLLGLSYRPLFDYFADQPNAFQILPGDFVTTEDGTGIVHIAPGFGEDDHALCQKYNIDVVCPVDEGARFTYPVHDFLDQHVFDANDEIIKKLKTQGNWVRTEQYIHNYPHCWRTDTPLIYKAMPSWYLKVTAIKDKMIANNQQINWIPGHVKNGLFGKWLENARDWSISRNRFWGCPIPVWVSDDPQYPHIEVYGSIAEIEAAFKVKVEDLHKPFIDTLTRSNPKDPTGKSVMRRVPDVLDCWFESGSMPYAQVHYPFENKEWFESHFPADFIVEYVAQTRGWFYTLLVLSTALFDRPPFLNCICHGVILGDGGQKLSKRLKNYADPNEVFEQIGADALRWYMISSPVMRGNEIVIDHDAKGVREVVRLVMKPIWNAYTFFCLYANADCIQAKFDLTSSNMMDRYIIAKCQEMANNVISALDGYDTIAATAAVEVFIECLNNWYIRRCRERFWKSEHDQDKLTAYNTLYSVLDLLCRTIAPMLPMLSEEIFTGLINAGVDESVHLTSMESFVNMDSALIAQMDRVRDACNAALSVRNEAKVRVRQPLSKVTFIGVSDSGFDTDMQQLVLEEINVKEWHNLDRSQISKYAHHKLHILFPALGKRLPNKVKEIIAANKAGLWEAEGDSIRIAGELLLPAEFELKLEPKLEYAGVVAALPSHDALVMLDTNVTDDLRKEGIYRDIVRAIQQIRKEQTRNITDKVELVFYTDDEYMTQVITAFQTEIAYNTLSTKLTMKREAEQKKASLIELEQGVVYVEVV